MTDIIKLPILSLMVLISVASASSFDEVQARSELAQHIERKSEIEQDFYNQLFERELSKGTFRKRDWRFDMIRWMDLVYETELGEKRVAYLLNEGSYAFSKAKAQFPEEMAALESGKSRDEVIAMADAESANGQAAKYRFFKRYLPTAQEYLILRRFNDADFEFDDLVYLGEKVTEIMKSKSDFKFHGASNQEKGQAFDADKLHSYYFTWGKNQVGPKKGELYGHNLDDFLDYYATYMTDLSRDQYSVSLNKRNQAARTVQENWSKAEGNLSKLQAYQPVGTPVASSTEQTNSILGSVIPEEKKTEEASDPEKTLEDKVDETIDSVIEEPKKKLKKLFGF